MRVIAFHQTAFDQYNEWAAQDKKIFERLRRLISETARTPFAESANPNHSNANSKGIGRVALQTSIVWCTRSLTNN